MLNLNNKDIMNNKRPMIKKHHPKLSRVYSFIKKTIAKSRNNALNKKVVTAYAVFVIFSWNSENLSFNSDAIFDMVFFVKSRNIVENCPLIASKIPPPCFCFFAIRINVIIQFINFAKQTFLYD